ncbi:hypothetical protein Tco_1317269 [Tanacetum coccineum]
MQRNLNPPQGITTGKSEQVLEHLEAEILYYKGNWDLSFQRPINATVTALHNPSSPQPSITAPSFKMKLKQSETPNPDASAFTLYANQMKKINNLNLEP